jgi:hypothetical protein
MRRAGVALQRMSNEDEGHGRCPENYVKLRLTAPDGLIETPRAERVGDTFRLDNLPWFGSG